MYRQPVMSIAIQSYSQEATKAFFHNFSRGSFDDESVKQSDNGDSSVWNDVVYPFEHGKLEKPTSIDKSFNGGWVFNISAGYKFSTFASNQLQLSYEKVVKPLLILDTANYASIAETLIATQFDYLCKLLVAGTCKTIYFDAAFSQFQFETIRHLQITRGTELINARLSYMFANQQQA